MWIALADKSVSISLIVGLIVGQSANCGRCEPSFDVGVCFVMDTDLLNKKFQRIGARLKVVERPRRRMRTASSLLTLDIGEDRRGEFFEIMPQTGISPEIEVLDVQPSDRHLLLLVREDGGKNKYLCGHDERHWFVAGIPESAPVGTVRQAKEALQPREVRSLASGCPASLEIVARTQHSFVRANGSSYQPQRWLLMKHWFFGTSH